VESVRFLVASTIEEATECRDLLVGPDMLGSAEAVLLVTSEEPDATLAALDRLEDRASPVRAVVSVSMLKEGWDVKNIYVIASVRSMESSLLTEQVLGRGLRLPFGQRTGNAMLDTVEVLSHRSFASLLKQAKSLLEETLGDRVDQASVVANPVAGRHTDGMPLGSNGELPVEFAFPTSGTVDVLLPGAAASDPDQLDLFSEEEMDVSAGRRHVGLTMATLDARVAAGAAGGSVLTRRVGAHPAAVAALTRRGQDPAVPALGGDPVGGGPVLAGVGESRQRGGVRGARSPRTTRRH
jgi:type III restriction enzyme